jgi:hypothetical protein
MYDKLRKELVNSPFDNPSGKVHDGNCKKRKNPLKRGSALNFH